MLAAVLAAAAAVALLPQPAVAATPAQEDYARSAARATNAERLAHDRRSLTGHRCLHDVAARHAKAMAAKDTMYHQDLAPVLRRCGMSRVSENVAFGYATGTAAVRGWMKSPPHRENLLARRYTRVAIAARRAADGTWYAAQVFGRPA